MKTIIKKNIDEIISENEMIISVCESQAFLDEQNSYIMNELSYSYINEGAFSNIWGAILKIFKKIKELIKSFITYLSKLFKKRTTQEKNKEKMEDVINSFKDQAKEFSKCKDDAEQMAEEIKNNFNDVYSEADSSYTRKIYRSSDDKLKRIINKSNSFINQRPGESREQYIERYEKIKKDIESINDEIEKLENKMNKFTAKQIIFNNNASDFIYELNNDFSKYYMNALFDPTYLYYCIDIIKDKINGIEFEPSQKLLDETKAEKNINQLQIMIREMNNISIEIGKEISFSEYFSVYEDEHYLFEDYEPKYILEIKKSLDKDLNKISYAENELNKLFKSLNGSYDNTIKRDISALFNYINLLNTVHSLYIKNIVRVETAYDQFIENKKIITSETIQLEKDINQLKIKLNRFTTSSKTYSMK